MSYCGFGTCFGPGPKDEFICETISAHIIKICDILIISSVSGWLILWNICRFDRRILLCDNKKQPSIKSNPEKQKNVNQTKVLKLTKGE